MIDPNKTISRELERHLEELTIYSFKNLNDEQQREVERVVRKIALLRRYFPNKELPSEYALLVEEDLKKNGY